MVGLLRIYTTAFCQSLDSDESLGQGSALLNGFWGFCPHLYDNYQRRLNIFKAVVEQIEVHEISVCLWIFTAIANTNREGDAKELYEAAGVETFLRATSRAGTPATDPNVDYWVYLTKAVLTFLLHPGASRFAEILYPLMVDYCG